MTDEHTVEIRPFQTGDLEPLIAFWNHSFADRRNYRPLSAGEFERRVLACPAFDPAGLLLAWAVTPEEPPVLAGLVHAFRPAPPVWPYQNWDRRHTIALLYVHPAHRHRGIGSGLLRAAERWLYYCPVYFASQVQPCYGTLEGPHPPFFGSTQRLGVNAHDLDLIRFLARRGYAVVDPGDVSLRLARLSAESPPPAPDLASLGLRLQVIDESHPFVGQEPAGREECSQWANHQDTPYAGLLLVDEAGLLQGQLCWYPMAVEGWAALVSFWVAPERRGRGLGHYLLDLALYQMVHDAPPRGGYRSVEVQTHLIHHARAADMYERRGFKADAVWVNLVKT